MISFYLFLNKYILRGSFLLQMDVFALPFPVYFPTFLFLVNLKFIVCGMRWEFILVLKNTVKIAESQNVVTADPLRKSLILYERPFQNSPHYTWCNVLNFPAFFFFCDTCDNNIFGFQYNPKFAVPNKQTKSLNKFLRR